MAQPNTDTPAEAMSTTGGDVVPVEATPTMPADNMAPITVSTWTGGQEITHVNDQVTAETQDAEILRQVEYYFSDENLPYDAHLLGLAGGDPNGPVSLSQICSWRKMRAFRPMSRVREVLRKSELVELVDNKHVRRKTPLTKQITVIPSVNEDRAKKAALATNPGLSKNMLKPTGFEPTATEGPITPAQYEEERKKYDPDVSIILRMEDAVNAFNDSRKMHQDTRAIWEKFLRFGGIEANTRQFQGGLNRDQLKKEGVDKDEIAQMTAYYGVTESVKDAMYAVEDGVAEELWVVDFEALAKAFLSSEFITLFDWYEEKMVQTATQVLRKFYNYLMVHDVCTEYTDQLIAARAVCDLADGEIPKLAHVDRSLPGAFNAACSTLYHGSYSGLHRTATWENDTSNTCDNIGLSDTEATVIFKIGIAAYGTDEQYEKANAALNNGTGFASISEEKLGLEIVSIEYPTDEVKALYADARERYRPFVHAMGKLHCVRWEVPNAAPLDLPKHVRDAPKARDFEFLLEEETLRYCVPGMKLEAVVMELDLGIKWIDSVQAVYPSFYIWLPNERIFDYKEPGPPTAWMKRQIEKRAQEGGEMIGEDGVEEAAEADYDSEEPD